MKYVVLLGDGMADEPLAELGGRTPLEAAATPHLDALAAKGETGLVRTVPEGFPPGSDVANLAALGYEPQLYYTGRSPLEAISMGVELTAEDVAFRCNLVTLSDEPSYAAKTMLDYSAGEISTAEAGVLIAELQQSLGAPNLHFYPGISYRHLLVWRGGPAETGLTPPHDISGQPIAAFLPRGEGAATLLRLMEESHRRLPDLPVNRQRRAAHQRQANSLWFWGQGKKPALPDFKDRYGLKGSVISAVDLVKGIGLCIGCEVVAVPGATGNIHTNFRGKVEAALEELKRGQDFVFIHVEAPDEAGHQGDLATKIRAIEAVDRMLGQLLAGLQPYPAFKALVLPDHPTPLRLRTHTGDPVPFVCYATNANSPETARSFGETTAAQSGVYYPSGTALMKRFING